VSETIKIAGRSIGEDSKPFVIAEMSCNHNGSLERAFEIMERAKDAGADALKLQTYTADTLTIDHDGPGFVIEGGLWDGRSLHELYEQASTPWEWHEALIAKGKELGLIVFSSPFDASAVDFLESLDAPAYKIASFEANDLPLIEKAASTGKPLIISTGIVDQVEIDDALSAARRAGAGGVALLYCVSGYPTPAEEANLATIPDMIARFDVPVGLSDHTLGWEAAVGAVALGACVIEKHFTIARADGGFDAAFSAEPVELEVLCHGVEAVWKARGQASYARKPSEEAIATYRRSLYVVENIKAGEKFTAENVRSIRPGYGLAPKHLSEIMGKCASRDVTRGSPLAWDLIAGL
jgi:N-acetylneuraminate synthase